MNTDPAAEAIEEPRLVPPGQLGYDPEDDDPRPAAGAGPLGREYLRGAISRLRFEPPPRAPEPYLEAEAELEAGG